MSDAPLKLFLITEDGETYYVEATTMQVAVSKWKTYMAAEDETRDEFDDPERCVLMHHREVIR